MTRLYTTPTPNSMKTSLAFLLQAMVLGTSYGQWSSLTMPVVKCQHGGAATFDKLYLAGGIGPNDLNAADIRVYDRLMGTWNADPMVLTEARGRIGCAINGGKLVCAGGYLFNDFQETSTVEIYDLATQEIEQVAQLSVARTDLSALAVGTKILFAGGADLQNNMPLECVPSDVVDIYDVVSGTWSIANLSQARFAMASAVSGDKVFFAGGHIASGEMSDRVDIYDNLTGIWSTATLSVPRAFYGGGVAVGDKVLFAGGQLPDGMSNVVDIYDTVDDVWSTATISEARVGIQAAAVGNYAVFAGGGSAHLTDLYYESASNTADVYDVLNDTWTDVNLNDERVNFVTLASGNQLFVTGGYDYLHDEVLAEMEVFTDASTIGIDEVGPTGHLNVWPNPFTDVVNLGTLNAVAGCTVEVFDARGTLVRSMRLKDQLRVDLSSLDAGLYHLRVLPLNGAGVITSGPIVKAQ